MYFLNLTMLVEADILKFFIGNSLLFPNIVFFSHYHCRWYTIDSGTV